jgi:hypothetical protein
MSKLGIMGVTSKCHHFYSSHPSETLYTLVRTHPAYWEFCARSRRKIRICETQGREQWTQPVILDTCNGRYINYQTPAPQARSERLSC